MADRWHAQMQVWPVSSPKGDPELQAALEEHGEEITADEYGSGWRIEQNEKRGDVLYVIAEEAPNGAEYFRRTDLAFLAKERGWAYVIADEGRFECHGEEISYSPEHGDRERAVLPGGELALSKGFYQQLKKGKSQAALARAVADYFEFDPYAVVVPQAHEIELEAHPRERLSGLAG